MVEVKKDILWRVYLAFFVMVTFAIVVISQTINLQFFQKSEIQNAVVAKTAGYREVEANRGDIYSCDGSLMATSMTYYQVGMDLSSKALTDENFGENIDVLSDSMSALLGGKSGDQFRRELELARKKKKRWYKLHDELTYSQFKRLSKFPLFNKGKYESGLVYTRNIKRKRPYEVLAFRTIGNQDSKGRPYGIEGALDKDLRGENGLQYQRKIGEGIWVPIDDANSIEPIDGYDVYTTIDMNIQDIAEMELLRKMKFHEADHGCVVVMEVQTGKIRAIANLKLDTTGKYWEEVNYAVMESAEPGSVFKTASLLALLEDGRIDTNTIVETGNGRITFYDKTIIDSHGPYGAINVKRILEVSSNVGTAKLITENYGANPKAFVDRLYKFGLTEKLGISIAGEGEPMIKYPGGKGWSGLTLPIMSYGYDMQLTPLQILAFYNAIANNGKKMKPQFIEKVVEKSGKVKSYQPEVLNSSICSKETIGKAKGMLEAVVENGTAKGIKSSQYKIAGKTGTAWFGYTRKKDEERHFRSSFVGYFPADNPKYSMIVVITDPKANGYYGGEVSAPVFKTISDRIYANMLDTAKFKTPVKAPIVLAKMKPVSMEDEYQLTKKIGAKNSGKKIQSPAPGTNTVPDVVGLGLKDAVYILENMGLVVKIKGRGIIRTQSLAPGTHVIKGTPISIELI